MIVASPDLKPGSIIRLTREVETSEGFLEPGERLIVIEVGLHSVLAKHPTGPMNLPNNAIELVA